MKPKTYADLRYAIRAARLFSSGGPRVSAVLMVGDPENRRYWAVPGYMDADTEDMQQILLVTPDGRVWEVRK
jgi:hypothetical protein